MTDARPEWKHKTPEELARWLQHAVVKITHHWQFTGVDTSKDWIELHAKDGDKRQVPTNFFRDNREFAFAPDHHSLVQSDRGIDDTIRKIDAWEKQNATDRAEYERLKRKFES